MLVISDKYLRLSKRILLLSLLKFFCLYSLPLIAVNAPVVTAGRITNAVPGTASVPIAVTVTNFTNVGQFTLTMKFDTTKVRFVSASTNASLTGMTVIYTPPSGNTQGKLVFSWSGVSNLSLADGAALANLTFSYVSATGILNWAYTYGAVCLFKTWSAGTLTAMTDSPKYSYYLNGGISDRTSPSVSAPVIINPAPGTVAIPITTTNFSTIGALTLYLEYNSSIITYQGTFTKNAAFNSSFLVGDIAGTGTNRMIVIQWYGASLSLTNGATVCTLNFTYSTTNGTNTNLNWFDNGPSCEFADGSGNVLIDMPVSSFYTNGYIGTALVDVLLHKTNNCGEFNVNLRPAANLSSNLTKIIFTVKWPAITGSDVQLSNNSPLWPGLAQTGNRVLYNGYYYVTYQSLTTYAVNWLVNTEYTILTLNHSGNGDSSTDFTIIAADYSGGSPGLNTAYKLEIASVNATGSITNDANAASLNCGLYLKDFLQGAYLTSTHLMKTNLANNNYVPHNQPYNNSPWLYTGTEHITNYPSGFVDWVLVELRSGTAAATMLGRRAGLLLNNGTITDTNGVSPLVFHTFSPGNSYYVVVYHRSHLPVMTKNAISLPNTSATKHDFTSNPATNVYSTSNDAVMLLETGIYGQIAGDINADNKLKYSGSSNDRGLIIAKISALYTPPPASLTSTISGYYSEDLNMDGIVKYSGSQNDQGTIFSNIDALTTPTTLTSIYTGQVPVSYVAKGVSNHKDKKRTNSMGK